MAYILIDRNGHQFEFKKIHEIIKRTGAGEVGLFLDSNICVDLEKISKNITINSQRKNDALNLISLYKSNKIRLSYQLPVLELSLNRNSMQLDMDRWMSTSSWISDILNSSIADYMFKSRFLNPLSNEINLIADDVVNTVFIIYANTLKIAELYLQSEFTKNYKDLLLEYNRWCDEEIDIFFTYNTFLCQVVLGGKNTKSRKAVGIGKNIEGIKKSCMSTAFDAYISTNYLTDNQNKSESYICTADLGLVDIVTSLRHELISHEKSQAFSLLSTGLPIMDRLSTNDADEVIKIFNRTQRERIISGKKVEPWIKTRSDIDAIILAIEEKIQDLLSKRALG